MRRPAAALSAILLMAAYSGAAGAGDADKGRELARQHCTRCHIVGDLNTMGIGSTPSFQYMVSKLADYEDRFLTFYSLRPHPAFTRIEGLPTLTDIPSPIAPVRLTLDDVEDITAFAATLKEN